MSTSNLVKVKVEPDTSDNENDHDLLHYIGNRVQLMQEVLKVIKPKKLQMMAPDCIKDKPMGEIKSMLLEELLGISNKRLRHIFNGDKLDVESSSSDSEEERTERKIQETDIISLDDITEDSDISMSNDIESGDLNMTNVHSDPITNVLNLLELQARARAIRSQLEIEKSNEKLDTDASNVIKSDSPNSVIVVSPANSPILVHSDSENGKLEETEVQIKVEKNYTDRNEIKTEISNKDMLETTDEDVLILTEPQDL